jgi:ATP-binding cassette, subfamily G (WHITE), member 2, PDR
VLVDGHLRSEGFARETGYVQQADIHITTSTVREALKFSAALRQPSTISTKEKLRYVDEVIEALEMESYADAVIGVPGDGKCLEAQFAKFWHAIELLHQC